MPAGWAVASIVRREYACCEAFQIRRRAARGCRLCAASGPISPAVYCSAETSNSENSPKSFVEVIDQDVWQPTSLFAE